MGYVGISDWKERLVGYGCDGASANMAAGGLRGHLENAVPCVVIFWCLSHLLELSFSDSLKNTYFATSDEMLLRLFYIQYRVLARKKLKGVAGFEIKA